VDERRPADGKYVRALITLAAISKRSTSGGLSQDQEERWSVVRRSVRRSVRESMRRLYDRPSAPQRRLLDVSRDVSRGVDKSLAQQPMIYQL